MNHQPEFRGKNISIGPNVKFGAGVILYDEVTVGDNSIIEDYSILGHPNRSNQGKTTIGKKCLIRSHSIIYAGTTLGDHCSTGHHVSIRENSTIGDGCSIGTNCDLQGHLTIGNYCRLHSDVHICQGAEINDFVFIYPRVTLTNDPYPPSKETRGPRIGSYSQICTASTILPGVEIGENCLIGAASLVSKNIPKHALAFGHPAEIKGDLSTLSSNGKPHYPWMYRFDRGMPWEGVSFDDWVKEQR